MSRALITICNTRDRLRVAHWAEQAPLGTRVLFKKEKRSLEQNDRMWAMLTDVARQLEWHGQKLRPDDWKLVFLDALKRERRTVPNIDGDGFVDLGRSSSDLSKEEMSELIDLISAFGANHGVEFGDNESFRGDVSRGVNPVPSVGREASTCDAVAGSCVEESSRR